MLTQRQLALSKRGRARGEREGGTHTINPATLPARTWPPSVNLSPLSPSSLQPLSNSASLTLHSPPSTTASTTAHPAAGVETPLYNPPKPCSRAVLVRTRRVRKGGGYVLAGVVWRRVLDVSRGQPRRALGRELREPSRRWRGCEDDSALSTSLEADGRGATADGGGAGRRLSSSVIGCLLPWTLSCPYPLPRRVSSKESRSMARWCGLVTVSAELELARQKSA